MDSDNKLSDVFVKIKERGFSRIPVYSKDPKNIEGILHIWDIAKLPEKEHKKVRIGDIARKPLFVYSNEKISDLLVDLKKMQVIWQLFWTKIMICKE